MLCVEGGRARQGGRVGILSVIAVDSSYGRADVPPKDGRITPNRTSTQTKCAPRRLTP